MGHPDQESNPVIDSTMLDRCCAIARRARAAILEQYGAESLSVTSKDDGSPLSAADLASHRIIVEVLSAETPFPVISEESFEHESGVTEPRTFWLVDPLDGTKDFLARNGEFTINIALVSDGAPLLGVVDIPVLGLQYAAAKGLGAWRRGDGAPVRIEYYETPGRLLGAESRFHAAPETAILAERLGATGLVTFGSSLKLCKLAEGGIDFYSRFRPTSGWDTAAGHAVLREAGCELYAMPEGNPLAYSLKRILNPPFLAAPRGRAGAIIPEMAALLSNQAADERFT